jgi:hypothetical protein
LYWCACLSNSELTAAWVRTSKDKKKKRKTRKNDIKTEKRKTDRRKKERKKDGKFLI